MNYSIIKCVNGAFSVEVEGTNLNNMKINFHRICQNLWNAPDAYSAKVMIIDEQLNCVDGYSEFIQHEKPVTE